MVRVLLTGGSGFIAAHVLDVLLERGHSVVTTVRSQDKAQKIRDAHADIPSSRLDFVVVEDIAKEGAFDQAVRSDPPFEAIIHTASPFQLKVDDTQRDLLDPAVIGTTGILRAAKLHAPTVERVVITSSFAAIVDRSKGNWPGHVYSEQDWNPITAEFALKNPAQGYSASKKLAEQAAWQFMESEKPRFSLSTINPPLVFGPVVHHLSSLSSLNTSNTRIRDMMQGQYKDEIPETGTYLWVDVRDVALAHVRAMEDAEAGGKRFFATAGTFSNRQLVEIIRTHFPELRAKLPDRDVQGGDLPKDGIYGFDNGRVRGLLGAPLHTLEESIVDTAKSLQAVAV